MLAISNQIPFLTSLINSRERRLSMLKPRARTASVDASAADPPAASSEDTMPTTVKAHQVIPIYYSRRVYRPRRRFKVITYRILIVVLSRILTTNR